MVWQCPIHSLGRGCRSFICVLSCPDAKSMATFLQQHIQHRAFLEPSLSELEWVQGSNYVVLSKGAWRTLHVVLGSVLRIGHKHHIRDPSLPLPVSKPRDVPFSSAALRIKALDKNKWLNMFEKALIKMHMFPWQTVPYAASSNRACSDLAQTEGSSEHQPSGRNCDSHTSVAPHATITVTDTVLINIRYSHSLQALFYQKSTAHVSTWHLKLRIQTVERDAMLLCSLRHFGQLWPRAVLGEPSLGSLHAV